MPKPDPHSIQAPDASIVVVAACNIQEIVMNQGIMSHLLSEANL